MDITTIYWILFLLGLGFAVVSMVFSGLGAGHDMDAGGGGHFDMGSAHMDAGAAHGDMGDLYHGQGEIAMNPVSPMTIFSFLGGFGGGGLIGHFLGLPIWGSLLVALPVGFILAFSIFYFMMVLNRSNVSSEAHISEAIGVTGELITPITEDGTGEIAYVSRGSRYTSPARSIDGKSISKGRPVKVWRVVGSTFFVKEVMPEEVESPASESRELNKDE
jgi:hypothetical protein